MSRYSRDFRRGRKKELSNQPAFYAPLTHNLLLTKGQGVATFTRTTTATCLCYLEAAIAGDSQVLQVIPSGVPRFEGARFIASNNTWSNLLSDGSAIPEATLKGVMIEVASTNYVIQSSNYSVSWSGINATFTSNQALGLFGVSDMFKLTEAATTNAHYAIGSNSLSGKTVMTFGVHAKYSGSAGRYLQLRPFNIGSGVGYANFNLLTGIVTASGGANFIAARITAAPSSVGGYICELTIDFTGKVAFIAQIGIVDSATGSELLSYTGDGTSGFYIGQSQLVDGYVLGSIIPTTGATVTRNADVLTFPNAGNVSDSAGTVYMEATPAFDIPNSGTAGYGSNGLIDFGNINGPIRSLSGFIQRFDGTTGTTTPTWTPLKNITYKIGSRYGSAGQRNWLNGTAGTNGTFDGSINSGANMTIGGFGGGTTYNWGGTIKNLKIWKRQLTDYQIVDL